MGSLPHSQLPRGENIMLEKRLCYALWLISYHYYAPQNGSLCSISMLALLAEKLESLGSAKDLVELPEASSPESYPSLETVVSDVLLQLGSSTSLHLAIFTQLHV